jgi:hypothetical protein
MINGVLSQMKKWLLVFLSVCLLGAAIAAEPDQSSAKVATSTDPKTGVTFPKRLGVFEREGEIEYDAGGNPTARYLAGRLIFLHAFYYKDNSFATEYASCRDSVKVIHPDARLISDSSSNLQASGRHAIFTYQDKFLGGAKSKLMSELMMFPHRDRYLKFRITYPAAHADRARREIDSFVRAFELP